MIDHHYDDTEQVEVAAGEEGSDNNMTEPQGFRRKKLNMEVSLMEDLVSQVCTVGVSNRIVLEIS